MHCYRLTTNMRVLILAVLVGWCGQGVGPLARGRGPLERPTPGRYPCAARNIYLWDAGLRPASDLGEGAAGGKSNRTARFSGSRAGQCGHRDAACETALESRGFVLP